MTVRAGLNAVGDACREILDRFFCRDESYRAIGESLNLPPGRSRAASRAAFRSFAPSWREDPDGLGRLGIR